MVSYTTTGEKCRNLCVSRGRNQHDSCRSVSGRWEDCSENLHVNQLLKSNTNEADGWNITVKSGKWNESIVKSD